jgi:hypothetical protein
MEMMSVEVFVPCEHFRVLSWYICTESYIINVMTKAKKITWEKHGLRCFQEESRTLDP